MTGRTEAEVVSEMHGVIASTEARIARCEGQLAEANESVERAQENLTDSIKLRDEIASLLTDMRADVSRWRALLAGGGSA